MDTVKLPRQKKIYLLIAGPGLIVMLADNDAGGITTYSVKPVQKFGYNFTLVFGFFCSLCLLRSGNDSPLRGCNKERTCRAIFHAFGSSGVVLTSRFNSYRLVKHWLLSLSYDRRPQYLRNPSCCNNINVSTIMMLIGN